MFLFDLMPKIPLEKVFCYSLEMIDKTIRSKNCMIASSSFPDAIVNFNMKPYHY